MVHRCSGLWSLLLSIFVVVVVVFVLPYVFNPQGDISPQSWVLLTILFCHPLPSSCTFLFLLGPSGESVLGPAHHPFLLSSTFVFPSCPSGESVLGPAHHPLLSSSTYGDLTSVSTVYIDSSAVLSTSKIPPFSDSEARVRVISCCDL